MRLFVHSDQEGNILSAMKVNIMAEDLEHPYGGLKDSDIVLEAEPTPELETLDCHEICDRFAVDMQSKQIRPKG